MTATHEDLCVSTTRWLLDRPWACVAGHEIGVWVGRVDAMATSCPASALEVAREQSRLARERARSAIDAYVVAHRAWREGGREGREPRHPGEGIYLYPPREEAPRIAVAEVKRTRSDLLADLRRGKMLAYELVATHCYLAATPEALGGATRAVLDDLAARGLPRTWGVLVLGGTWITSLRPSRAVRSATEAEVAWAAVQIGRSYSYRRMREER